MYTFIIDPGPGQECLQASTHKDAIAAFRRRPKPHASLYRVGGMTSPIVFRWVDRDERFEPTNHENLPIKVLELIPEGAKP